MSLSRNMNSTTNEDGDGDNEEELRQLLMEMRQLTKQQISYTTVLQSLNERQSAVNDRLLHMGAAVENGQAWTKLKNMSELESDNQTLRNKVDELTKAEQLLDTKLRDLKSKLSESTANSKKLLQCKQQLQRNLDDLKTNLDSSELEQERQQVEVNRLEKSTEELAAEKLRLLQRVNELTAYAKNVYLLQRETLELREKVANMERLQALRNLRELEDTCMDEETTKMRLELMEETTGACSAENNHSDHAIKLKAVYRELATRFDAVSAAAWMFQHGALTLKELQSIQSLRDRPTEAAESLLNVVIEQPNAVYDSFLDALKYSNQQHVYRWIVYDACSCDGRGNGSNVERVREHYLFLVEKLDLKFSGLLHQLYADGVVESHEMEDIASQLTSVRQNERFLCLMSLKSVEQFQTFLRDLDNSDQSYIRNRLENKRGFLMFLYLLSNK